MMEIEKYVLSIEQMKRLRELGLKVEDTALSWADLSEPGKFSVSPNYENAHEILREGCVITPTLTLQEILELLPKYIETGCLNRNFRFKDSLADCLIWYEINSFEVPIVRYKGSTFLDAAYKTLCWVLENGYLNQ